GKDEPNVMKEQISSSVERRILALEDRIDDLEQRINQLEKSGTSPVESPEDSNDSESNCEKARKQIQDAKDSIELVNAQINSISQIDTRTAENRREIDTKRYKLLVSLERNYSKIIHLAEKCPALNIDTMELQKKLIECQAEKREAEMKRKALQDSTRDSSSKRGIKGWREEEDSSNPPPHRRPAEKIRSKGTVVVPKK
ncbi:MAG: hypothetical protein MUP16_04970, partial [Sedimentisphaerales bacterium]|nr:hypothetical protein [Sedimentisphaerales bacterium]